MYGERVISILHTHYSWDCLELGFGFRVPDYKSVFLYLSKPLQVEWFLFPAPLYLIDSLGLEDLLNEKEVCCRGVQPTHQPAKTELT